MGIAFKHNRPKFVVGAWLVMQCLSLSGCKPWTLVPISAASDPQALSQNPAAFVDSIWSAKLVPAIVGSAVDVRTLLAAMSASIGDAEQKYGRNVNGDGWYFNVKGEGTVLAVDTSSRNGLIELGVLPHARRPDVSIQIGPVFRGSALRDSTGLIAFSSFVNQLQFAVVADDLNSKANQTVLSFLDAKMLVGKKVKFVGSFEAGIVMQPLIANVVPVQFVVESRQ